MKLTYLLLAITAFLSTISINAQPNTETNIGLDDSDNDMIIDKFDSTPLKKVKPMTLRDNPLPQVFGFHGVFDDAIAKDKYRYNDLVTLNGTDLEVIENPIVVVHNRRKAFNFEIDKQNKNSFKLAIPPGKYFIFVYDRNRNKKTNEIWLEAYPESSPLIFGYNSVALTKGEHTTIKGIGFNKSSRIIFGGIVVEPTAVDDNNLSFYVPTNITSKNFFVRNNNLKSNKIGIYKYE